MSIAQVSIYALLAIHVPATERAWRCISQMPELYQNVEPRCVHNACWSRAKQALPWSVTKSPKSWKLVVLRSYERFQHPLVTLRRGMTSVAHQAPCGRPACASLDPQLADRHRLEPAAGYRDLSGRVVCCTSRPRFSRCDSSAAR